MKMATKNSTGYIRIFDDWYYKDTARCLTPVKLLDTWAGAVYDGDINEFFSNKTKLVTRLKELGAPMWPKYVNIARQDRQDGFSIDVDWAIEAALEDFYAEAEDDLIELDELKKYVSNWCIKQTKLKPMYTCKKYEIVALASYR